MVTSNNNHTSTRLVFIVFTGLLTQVKEGKQKGNIPIIVPHKNHKKISSSQRHSKANVQFNRGKGQVVEVTEERKGPLALLTQLHCLLWGSPRSCTVDLWDHLEKQIWSYSGWFSYQRIESTVQIVLMQI